MANYFHMARNGDAGGMVDLFCDDVIMESGDTREQGRDKLLTMYRETFAQLHPLPCVHNHVISLEGDRARGTVSVEVRMVLEGVAITAAGHYEDEYRRVGTAWKFAHRNLVMYHQVPHTEGWV